MTLGRACYKSCPEHKEYKALMFFGRDDKKDSQNKEEAIPLLPLRDIIVFPHMVVPLFVGRQKSIRALEEAMAKQKSILLAAQKDAKTNEPAEDDIYRIGTLGTVVQLVYSQIRRPAQR